MINSTPTNADTALFKTLFAGYSQAHGVFEMKSSDPETGKIKGSARTVSGSAPIQAWEEHLAGGPRGLGAIPLLDDGASVKWGAIDIDVNDIDHFSLEAKVNELGLPLFICRSKSGGAHCFLFLKRPCSAKGAVDALTNWSAALGYPGVEIFPKQTRREIDAKTGKPRPGNWINLPYLGAEKTERYCVYHGKRISLGEFISLAADSHFGQEALNIQHNLATLSGQTQSSKSLEGRNGFLYSNGCVLRLHGAEEDKIRSALTRLNEESTSEDHPNFANGPLQSTEVEKIISSVLKQKPGGFSYENKDLIADLNARHAVVMVGGKCVIVNEEVDPAMGFKTLSFSSQGDFINRYANRIINRGEKITSAGRAWLAHPDRRQFDGITFAPGETVPGYLNLDRGFAVEPIPGDCSRYLDHLRNNICSGDEDLSDYLLAWMADCVQNRSRRPGVAVVMRGRQGTGKGVLCGQFGALFGPHFIQISQASHLTGHFNSHLKDKLVVYADEAFWAGDKRAEGVLKAMITEETIQVEMKGKDVITFRNHIRLMVSSNNSWVVPAGNEERRFFVLDISEARMQDRPYFGGIVDQMNNGGREALLHYLLEFDLSGIDLGKPPQTQALCDQKEYSASPLQSWWFEKLMDGETIKDSTKWADQIRTEALYEDYCETCETLGVKRRLSPNAFGKELRKLAPGFEKIRITERGNRKWSYSIPGLDSCRNHFELITRHKHDWPAAD